MDGPIVVGTDGSTTATAAVLEATRLAAAFDQPLHIVCAYRPEPVSAEGLPNKTLARGRRRSRFLERHVPIQLISFHNPQVEDREEGTAATAISESANLASNKSSIRPSNLDPGLSPNSAILRRKLHGWRKLLNMRRGRNVSAYPVSTRWAPICVETSCLKAARRMRACSPPRSVRGCRIRRIVRRR